MHPAEALLVPLGKAFRNRRSGAGGSITNSPGLQAGTRFALTSPSFADGAEIPAKFCGALIGENISPALAWGTLPANTTDLLLVIEDVDGPGKLPRIHTIATFPSTAGGLAEGALTPDAQGVQFLPRNGKPGRYAGPRPLPGHGPHLYRFHLYALDARPDLSRVAGPEQLVDAVAGHVLASGMLTGTRAS